VLNNTKIMFNVSVNFSGVVRRKKCLINCLTITLLNDNLIKENNNKHKCLKMKVKENNNKQSYNSKILY